MVVTVCSGIPMRKNCNPTNYSTFSRPRYRVVIIVIIVIMQIQNQERRFFRMPVIHFKTIATVAVLVLFIRVAIFGRFPKNTPELLISPTNLQWISPDLIDETTTAACSHNGRLFTRLSDRERPFVTKKKIPPILYQTSKDRCVATSFYNVTIRTWLEQQPEEYSLGYQFYDDSRMEAYLSDDAKWSSIFPGLSLALRCIDHVQLPVMKADIWRYLILWESGGIFADLDVALDGEKSFLRHLKTHDDEGVFVIVGNQAGNQRLLSQWLLATAPRHPLMYYAAEHAISRVLKAKRALPIQHTGPRALYDATDRFLQNQGSNVSRYLKVHQVYTEDIASDESSSYLSRKSHPFSFRVVPASWAQNMASSEEKSQAYAAMNMTHYMDKQKGKKKGGGGGGTSKPYSDGKTCLGFLGGNLIDEKRSFVYKGAIHHFLNPMPDIPAE